MSLLTPLLWIAIMLPFIILAIVKANTKLKSLHQHFAWRGEILSLLLSLGIIFSLNIQNREAVGFTFKTSSKNQ